MATDAAADEPVLMSLIANGASSVAAGLHYASEKLNQAKTDVQIAQAREQAREISEAELRARGHAPWETLSEQFSILEPELKQRILNISKREELFTSEIAQQRSRPASVLPGVLPMANAAMEGDPQLGALRYRLVPQRLSEEDFWRCYFWHVANAKLELCNDFVTANRARRDASLATVPAAAPVADFFSLEVLTGATVEHARDVPGEGQTRLDEQAAHARKKLGTELEQDDASFVLVAAEVDRKDPELQDFPFDLATLDAEFEALVGTSALEGNRDDMSSRLAPAASASTPL